MRKLLPLFVAVFLFSCQNEDITVNQNNDAALTRTSPLSSLMMRVCQNETHADNILDGDDCYSVQLPVTITLNGQNMYIDNENDFDAVQQNMDLSWSDDDVVYFHFPITIVMRNFQQQVISSQAQLDAVACTGNDDFNEISCLDFEYPISVNIYDTNNQIANTVTIGNDTELYNFVYSLSAETIFTVVYPLTLMQSGGGAIVVNSNNELEDNIENAIGDCNGGPGPWPIALQDIITSGTWHISYCEGDSSGPGPGPEHYYDGWNFTFNANGTLTAVKNSMTNGGTWSLYQDSHQMMDLFFPTDPLQGLSNDEWRVTEYNPTNFRLKNDASSWDGYEYCYFTKN